MTNRFLHCPFCADNIDATSVGNFTAFGVIVYCEHCESTFMVFEEDFWKKSHQGLCTKYAEPCDMEGTG